ncbi:MAG: hypothetical protein J6M16_09255 [Clostridia bacterium]|nr:hypothetical protein [Clostridia bacterium]
MSVYKVRYGTPEEFVPSKFAPAPKCEIIEAMPEGLKDMEFKATKRGAIFRMPIEKDTDFFGFGLQLKGINQKGNKITIQNNADPRSNNGFSHAPVPFFITQKGWGIFVDTARYAKFYCGKQKKTVYKDVDLNDKKYVASLSTDELYAVKDFSVDVELIIEIPYAEGADLYYITGEKILDIVMQYNMLGGGGCMPALWGLGGYYRTCGRFNETQALDMAKRIREHHIPCDIYGLEPGWQTYAYSCTYDWDTERFKNYKETIKELTELGFKLNLWEHCYTRPTCTIHDDIFPYCGKSLVFDKGLVPDFTIKEAREIFASKQRDLVNDGVRGFKLDECDGSDITGGWNFPDCDEFPSGMDGEVYHNLLGTLYGQVNKMALGNLRSFQSIRSFGALCSSYNYSLYSDLTDPHDYLRGLVNAGFTGILWTPEVGGNSNTQEELRRRLQTVIFSPQALINAWYIEYMPWEKFGCEEMVKEILDLRMQLVPYLYSKFYEYYRTGKPPVRSVLCDYPGEDFFKNCEDEYLFGDMLVAPIITPAKGREVVLPKGTWYNFFTGEKLEGGKHYIETNDVPVFVRDGDIIPLAKPVEYMPEDVKFEITLRAYGDAKDASFTLIEDDGVTDDTDYREITVTMNDYNIDSFRYEIVGTEEIK